MLSQCVKLHLPTKYGQDSCNNMKITLSNHSFALILYVFGPVLFLVSLFGKKTYIETY